MVKDIEVALCDARADARAIDGDAVRAIAASMADAGQINPIWVRAKADGRFEIIAGAHRVAACRALGLVEVEARIVDIGDAFAELAMIDENLCRSELSPADRARQTFRRKQLYLELFPETAAGVAQAAGMNAVQRGGQVGHDVARFDVETARLSGQSERAVRRDAERGEKVCDEAFDLLRGTVLDTGSYLDGLKRLSPDDQVAAVERDLERAREIDEERRRQKIEAKKDRRADREAELGARQQALPDKRYGVILADPEWQFDTWSEAGMDRSADNHYPTSPLEAIKSRNVPSIAADDCVLLLWATAPMHEQAFEVMRAWGFVPKTEFIWLKDRPGTGYWNRNQHEILMLGTRGNVPAPAMGDQFRSALAYPVGEHSAKPPFAHEIAEAYFPSLPKIELNARTRRDGWDAWGLEAPESSVNADEATSSAGPEGEVQESFPGALATPTASGPELGASPLPALNHTDASASVMPGAGGDEAGATALLPAAGVSSTTSAEPIPAATPLEHPPGEKPGIADAAASGRGTAETTTPHAPATPTALGTAGEAIQSASPVIGEDLVGDVHLRLYRRLVADDEDKGRHTRVTAEMLLRAAYACTPVVPTKTIAADLGAPIGSVLGWASRLGLTSAARRGGPDGIGQRKSEATDA